MATDGVSTFRACADKYKDPTDLFLAISCVSMIAGKLVNICGKNCDQYVNLIKIGGVFGDLFDFWDSATTIQASYGGVQDAKTVLWDHYYKGKSVERIRLEGNDRITKQVDPYRWLAERVVFAALKTFGATVLAYAALSRMEAIISAPSPTLKAWGAAAGAFTYVYTIFEQERKVQDGPVLQKIDRKGNVVSKLNDGVSPARYTNLYNGYHEHEKYKKITFFFIKLVFIAAALRPVAEPGSLLNRISTRTSDMLTAGFSIYGAIDLKQHLQFGAEMKSLEKNK